MYRPLASLRANPRNARTHTKAQLRQIADSIRAFGFLNPIILDERRGARGTCQAGSGLVSRFTDGSDRPR
jgi:ParB-like chromosome segregation protein Spo0J